MTIAMFYFMMVNKFEISSSIMKLVCVPFIVPLTMPTGAVKGRAFCYQLLAVTH